MLCLSILQPYAHMICVLGHKRVENRDWPCGYRGRLLIHAGKSDRRLAEWDEFYPGQPRPDDLAFGAIIGGCQIVGCFRRDMLQTRIDARPGDAWLAYHIHVQGPFCFVLDKAHYLAKPIPYRGMQKLFTVPDEVVAGAEWIAAHGQDSQEIHADV